MATNYYVLDGTRRGSRLRVAYHVEVPNSSNAAGTNWRTAVTEFLSTTDDGTLSKVPGLASSEQNKLDAGELAEWVDAVEDDANAPPATRKANVEAHVSAAAAERGQNMADRLQHWGESGSV